MSEFRLSKQAEQDLLEIWAHVAGTASSLEIADGMVEQIAQQFPSLTQFQELGRRRDKLIPGLRSFVVNPYLIYYRLIPEGLEIVRILHGARDVEAIFSEGDES
ncbi:MAG: type II toxin-antitoxin system RelE/ParE family toxin [Elainellaceae cyanobacterium]